MAISGGSAPFDFARLKEFLLEFGFSKREISVYAALLKQTESSPSELSVVTGFDRADVYRVLNKLLRKGFVVKVLDRPARFTLSSPKKAFLSEIESQFARISLFKEQVEGLDELQGYYAKKSKDNNKVGKIELIRGQKQIFEKIVEMLSAVNCKNEICYFATGNCCKQVFAGLINQFKLAFSRKVELKILLPISRSNLDQVRALSKFADVRHVASSSSRIMIVDRKMSLLFYSSDDFVGHKQFNDVGLWTDNKTFSVTQGLMFDSHWQLALDMNYRIKDLQKKIHFEDVYDETTVNDDKMSTVFLVDSKGKITHVLKNIKKLTGYDVEDYVNKPYLDKAKQQVHPEDLQKISKVAKQVFEGIISEEEIRIFHKSGKEVWFSFSVLPLLSKTGKIESTRVILRNITTKKREQETSKALRENEKKYRDLIENIQIAIAVIDENNKVTLVNSILTELLGYSKEEMIGKSVFSFIDNKLLEAYQKYLSDPQNKEDKNFTFQRKDGSELFLRLRPIPIFDLEGNYKGVQATLLSLNSDDIKTTT